MCRDFPDACFLLKGKNVEFLKIPYFNEIIEEFRCQSNLRILDDMEVWTPFSSVAAADIGFARHTSLGDEMLALGKPVIFDDFDGFPGDIYDYGSSVVSKSYEETRQKFSNFFDDKRKYSDDLSPLRNYLFTTSKEPIRHVINKELCTVLRSE